MCMIVDVQLLPGCSKLALEAVAWAGMQVAKHTKRHSSNLPVVILLRYAGSSLCDVAQKRV